MVHEDYKEMIPAHALSALDAAEARALNDHLSECAECRMELQEWEATAATMAVSASPEEPSPKVRERILSEVRNDLAAPQVLPFRSATRNIWSSFGSLGAMAAVILVTALIVSLAVLWRENRAARDQVKTLAAQLDKTRKDLERSDEFFKLVTSPGGKMSPMAGTDVATGATAQIAYDKSGRAMLVAHGLPSLPQGKEYQLWFIKTGTPPVPGKVFAPDSTGSAVLQDQMPDVALDADVFAITLEPAGGVPAPTGAIYLRTNLQ